jgi:lysophospholipase L1-like esterase
MTMSKSRIFIPAFLVLIACHGVFGQDPQRYKAEISAMKATDATVAKKNLNLFTGSSSIRFWKDLGERFPEYNVANRGFGGSQMSELFYYGYELIIDYKPRSVFIYEGDNDLSEGKTSADIIHDADKIVRLIRSELGKKVKIWFITPKPSIRRWQLKDKYEGFISTLKSYTSGRKNVGVIDVWTPMLDHTGALRTDLFVEDDLHMNEKGYDVWAKVIEPYLKKK